MRRIPTTTLGSRLQNTECLLAYESDDASQDGALEDELAREQPFEARPMEGIHGCVLITMPKYPDMGDDRSRAFQQGVLGLISSGCRKLILDYSEMLFWGELSGGIEFHILRTLRKNKGEMVMVGVRPEILKVLAMLGLDKIFTIKADTTQAIDYLRGTD